MLGGLAVLATALTIAPWTIRNLPTFDRTTFLTTGDGSVFKGANCPGTYRGGFTGGWDIRCLARRATPRDESVLSAALRATRFDYARTTRAGCRSWSPHGWRGPSRSTRPRAVR